MARQAFQFYDRDRSGTIDANEFYQALVFLHLNISPETSRAIFDMVDGDRNGRINIDEFTAYYVANF